MFSRHDPCDVAKEIQLDSVNQIQEQAASVSSTKFPGCISFSSTQTNYFLFWQISAKTKRHDPPKKLRKSAEQMAEPKGTKPVGKSKANLKVSMCQGPLASNCNKFFPSKSH